MKNLADIVERTYKKMEQDKLGGAMDTALTIGGDAVRGASRSAQSAMLMAAMVDLAQRLDESGGLGAFAQLYDTLKEEAHQWMTDETHLLVSLWLQDQEVLLRREGVIE